jgi:hypothetical protein
LVCPRFLAKIPPVQRHKPDLQTSSAHLAPFDSCSTSLYAGTVNRVLTRVNPNRAVQDPAPTRKSFFECRGFGLIQRKNSIKRTNSRPLGDPQLSTTLRYGAALNTFCVLENPAVIQHPKD